MSGNVLTVILAGVLAALISAFVTVYGWSVTRRREEEKRQRETDLRHLQRQIEELYGPLLGLLRQQQIAYEVATQLVPRSENSHPDIRKFSPEQREAWNFLAANYLIPIQKQMCDLLWSKIYLLESGRLPESFEKFIANASQFECLHRLAAETQVSSLNVHGKEWPENFRSDVEETLANLAERYDQRHHG
jgi:hypothetical protein